MTITADTDPNEIIKLMDVVRENVDATMKRISSKANIQKDEISREMEYGLSESAYEEYGEAKFNENAKVLVESADSLQENIEEFVSQTKEFARRKVLEELYSLNSKIVRRLQDLQEGINYQQNQAQSNCNDYNAKKAADVPAASVYDFYTDYYYQLIQYRDKYNKKKELVSECISQVQKVEGGTLYVK